MGDIYVFSIIGGNCSRIGDRTIYFGFRDGGRRASENIEAGEVDAKAAAAGSISIVVHLH
jgi:hypothetical protein